MGKLARWFPSFIFGALMWASQVKPEEAASNLAAWLQYFGLESVPTILQGKVVDQWIFGAALVGFLLYTGFLLRKQIRSAFVLTFQGTSPSITPQITKPIRLKIVFRYDMPWVQLQHNIQEPGAHIAHAGSLFTYRLAIINHVCDLAEGVTVEMISIDPQVVAHRLVPCRLHFRHDNPTPPQPYLQETDVPRTSDQNYQDALFVDVFWFWESPQSEKLGIGSSVARVDQRIPVKTYKFTVKVSSKNCGPPVMKEFRFIHRGKDRPPTLEPDDSLPR